VSGFFSEHSVATYQSYLLQRQHNPLHSAKSSLGRLHTT